MCEATAICRDCAGQPCAPAICGDGATTGGEDCDDGNTINGDGCDSNCTPTGCGNGVVTAGEACDDGNATDGDGCDTNCTVTACGNGIQTLGEQCDDGNTNNFDGCRSNCTSCGDFVLCECATGGSTGTCFVDGTCPGEPPPGICELFCSSQGGWTGGFTCEPDSASCCGD
jgi:cysteine-rich repeat protein